MEQLQGIARYDQFSFADPTHGKAQEHPSLTNEQVPLSKYQHSDTINSNDSLYAEAVETHVILLSVRKRRGRRRIDDDAGTAPPHYDCL